MSKKSSKRKKTTSKKRASKKSRPRKGKKAPFKQHGTRGVRASQARANKAKRERRAKNARASKKARGVSIPVPAGYKGPLPGVSAAGIVALTPAARKRARKAAAQAASGSTSTVVVPVPAGYIGAVPGAGAPVSAKKPGKKKRRSGKKRSKKAASRPAGSATPKTTRARKKRRVSQKGSAPKLQLMSRFGFPHGTRAKISPVRRAQLRKAAGEGPITLNSILSTVKNNKLKSWVCVGPRRSGCGGGAKNLRGGHQIGIFKTMH